MCSWPAPAMQGRHAALVARHAFEICGSSPPGPASASCWQLIAAADVQLLVMCVKCTSTVRRHDELWLSNLTRGHALWCHASPRAARST